MIKLLASVSGPAEALVALRGGADIIDLKNPSDGALGAVSPKIIEETIAAVGARRAISAVAGNLPMEPEAVARAIEARCAADYVKIGLFPASREDIAAVIEAASHYSEKSLLIAVLFADREPDFSLLEELADHGFCGAMLDTMEKGAGGLTRHLSPARLRDFVTRAKSLNLMVGLAGSLEAPDVQRLSILEPDYLGFRGALTSGRRDAAIDEARVREIATLIAGTSSIAHPLSDPSHALDRQDAPVMAGGDRVFVEDFVLPLEIGAYAHEHGRTQEVRFSVEAIVAPIPSAARTMADIYSYDVIIDAIRTIAEAGHTVLVEELATRLAEDLLLDPRVRQIRVRIEKLGLGPGAVGVEIARRRPQSAPLR
ncbi:(5-formylfuran-3-yl)methyl phosphate synthase [Fulvimarina sp. 2208YS6-2-32]|uniref:(5-formylfuran-3-yl)methyl phosphate synthase n=1 Tax=Fulvimarina uroteuthidis TaxID=3098149 RepID=A0ABU5HYL4_9HYPH|nr:(5-formylfuran-3-yl)methyl phosphate synthase [Fulvimarina sp. 2208YS6-2-32]MDY8107868.1 (5-formylfuran-3-yl)methyl phosphate synthase [Fulvimarina sp. 2208YS6-2-32]